MDPPPPLPVLPEAVLADLQHSAEEAILEAFLQDPALLPLWKLLSEPWQRGLADAWRHALLRAGGLTPPSTMPHADVQLAAAMLVPALRLGEAASRWRALQSAMLRVREGMERPQTESASRRTRLKSLAALCLALSDVLDPTPPELRPTELLEQAFRLLQELSPTLRTSG